MRKTAFLLILIISGCTSSEKKSEAENDEIKQLARAEGDKISLTAQKALGGQLKKAISEQGPTYAVQFCNTAAYPILDTITSSFNVSIKRASLRLRNPKNKPTDAENKILEQYQGQLDQEDAPEAVVEELHDGKILYVKPIILDNPLCLNCHGQPGSQVLDETYALIKKLYPEDKAINHQMGDLRGIWSITLNKKELVDYLEKTR